MRLKQATSEIAPTLRKARTSLTQTPQQEEQSAVRESQVKTANAAALMEQRTLPVNTVVNSEMQMSTFPSFQHILKVSAVGVLYAILDCAVVHGTNHYISEAGQTNLTNAIGILSVLSYILLPVLLTFRLGWRQRNGLQGALLGLALSTGLFLGGWAYALVLPSQPSTTSIRDHAPIIPSVIVLVLFAGALSGTCGHVWQALVTRSRKNNR